MGDSFPLVPEMESSEELPADSSPLRRVLSSRPRLAVWGVLILLAFAVVMLRFHRIAELPPGLHVDAGANGADALEVLQGRHALFFPEKNNGREWLGIYPIALTVSLMGRTELAVRLPTILAGVSAIFAVFWLGRLLFGKDESGRDSPWRGLVIGGVAAGLLVVSTNHTVLGRTANTAQPVMLFLCLSLALFQWGWGRRASSRGSWWRIVLAGACAGLLLHTYVPARFTPFLYILFSLSFLWPVRLVSWGSMRAELPWLLAFWGAYGLVAAPMLIHFALNPEHLFLRSKSLWLFDPGLNQGEPFWLYLQNVWGYLKIFGIRGDPDWRSNFASRPMLNVWEAAFFWLGVCVAARRWRLPEYRLLLIWLGVMLLPATLAVDHFPLPNTTRMIGAVPAIYLLLGVGVWEAAKFLKKGLFARHDTGYAVVAGVVVGGMILVQGVVTYLIYFQKWADAPEIRSEYEFEWSILTKYLNAQPHNPATAFLIPDGQRQQPLKAGFRSHTFDYLYQGETPAYLFHTAMPDFANRIQSTMLAVDDLSTVNVVEWNLKSVWTGDEYERFAFLLGKYGHYRDSEELGSFRVHRYTDVSLSTPWKPYEFLEPLHVVYDGGIELLAVALGRGQDQLSIEEPILIRKSRNIWTVLQWQTAHDLNIEYSVSLRLRNAESPEVYLKDLLLWKTDHTVTGDGGPAEQFDTWIHLDIPADIPPGEYELRLIVYDTKTLKPTVEMEVWEPERTLAILRVVAAP